MAEPRSGFAVIPFFPHSLLVEKISGRDRAIDIVRGIAIFSMVSAHLASGYLIAKPTHSVPYFSGASAFYLLSGLLLGMVNRRKFLAAGGDSRLPIVATLKRLRIVYVSQLFICCVAAVAVAVHVKDVGLRPLDGEGWLKSVWLIASLQYAPPGANALRLYVVFMVLAILVFVALAAGKYLWVVAASAATYMVGLTFPESALLTLPTFGESVTGANWATWQALFVPAMVVGWLWSERNVADWLKRNWRALIVMTAAGCAISIALPRIGAASDAHDFLAGGVTLGPGWLTIGYLMVAALYVSISWLIPLVWEWTYRPIELIGQRSLDSYVIQGVALVLLPLAVGYNWPELKATAIVVGVLTVCWGWAYLREKFGIAKLHEFYKTKPSNSRRHDRTKARHRLVK